MSPKFSILGVEMDAYFITFAIILIVSGLGAFVVTQFKLRKVQLNSSLTPMLWHFRREKDFEDQINYYKWSWYKLFCSGGMLVSISALAATRFVSGPVLLVLCAIFMTIWLIGLCIFWRRSILPSLEQQVDTAVNKPMPR